MTRRITQQSAFRLTPTARTILARIAEQDGQTQTAIVERLIRDEGKRRHITVPTESSFESSSSDDHQS